MGIGAHDDPLLGDGVPQLETGVDHEREAIGARWRSRADGRVARRDERDHLARIVDGPKTQVLRRANPRGPGPARVGARAHHARLERLLEERSSRRRAALAYGEVVSGAARCLVEGRDQRAGAVPRDRTEHPEERRDRVLVAEQLTRTRQDELDHAERG